MGQTCIAATVCEQTEVSIRFWWAKGGKETLGRNKGRWENNIKMDAQEIGWDFMGDDDDDDDDEQDDSNDKAHSFICRVSSAYYFGLRQLIHSFLPYESLTL